MTQEILVDLDLHGNKIGNVAVGTLPSDAVNVSQLGDSVQVPTTPPPPPGSVIVWDPAAGTPPGTGGWVPVDPTSPTFPVVPTTREISVGDGLTGGGLLSTDVGIGFDFGKAITYDPAQGGVTINPGAGLMLDADPADTISVDKTVLDGWYLSIPGTTPGTTPPGTTIVWDGDSWELVLPGTLPPPAPSGTLIGAATVVVIPGVVVAAGTADVLHDLGNNNVIAVVQDTAGCQVIASVCGGSDANHVAIGAEDGTYTVIVTGIKTL